MIRAIIDEYYSYCWDLNESNMPLTLVLDMCDVSLTRERVLSTETCGPLKVSCFFACYFVLWRSTLNKYLRILFFQIILV